MQAKNDSFKLNKDEQKRAEQKRIRHHVKMLWITTIFLGLIPAAFILLKVHGRYHNYVRYNAKQALNLFLSICFYMLCLVGISQWLIKHAYEGMGVSVLGVIYVINIMYVILCVYGLVKGSALKPFKMPFTMPLFR